jgi:hypothetical protein
VIGVPTDVIATPFFTRMTSVRWWDYVVLVITVVLTALWAGIRTSRRVKESSSGVLGTSVVSALAVGCPICNKVVVGLLGVSGALSIWAPIQPVLAVLSVAALLAAVIVRWRRRDCTDESCAPETPDTSPTSTDPAADGETQLQTQVSAPTA